MKPVYLRMAICLVVWLCLPSGVIAAATSCTNSENCVVVGEIELGVSLGLGVRSNPVENGDEIPLLIIPSLSYYGEHFFINNLDLGYSLLEGGQSQLNVLLTPGYDSMFFDTKDPRNVFFDGGLGAASGIAAEGDLSVAPQPDEQQVGTGSDFSELDHSTQQIPPLEDRDFAILGGLEYSRWNNSDIWHFQILHDVSDVHHGYEIRSAWRRVYEVEEQSWFATFGIAWKSEDLNNYYYGVSSQEAGQGRSEYDADGGLNLFMRLSWRRPLSEKWQLRADVQYDQLSGAISDSPLVKESYSVAVFVGVKYRIW